MNDRADLVSRFMSLPPVLQRAALMAVSAGRDVPEDQTEFLTAVFEAMSNSLVHEESRHFASMCGNMLTSLTIARHVGRGAGQSRD